MDQYSHFFNSMPSGALPSTFFAPTSFQFVDSTVPFDSTCLLAPKKNVIRYQIFWQDNENAHRERLWLLTKDLLIALLVSSSASPYMSLKNLFNAASPSSFSSFS